MAVSIIDLAKTAKTAMGKKLLRDIARESNLLSVLPIASVPGVKVTSYRYNALPTAGTRALNGSYSESTGRIEPVTETLHMYGMEAKIDRVAALAKSEFAPQVQLQMDMMKDALQYKIANDFISGNHGVDPNGFEGLVTRVTNGLAKYDINRESGGVSVNALSSQDNARLLLDTLHLAKRYLGGKADVIFGNETTIDGIGRVLRYLAQGNLLSQTQDNYERTWDTVMGAKLVDIGPTDFNGTSEIISNTQGTDTVGTSIFVVRMGDEEGLNMIQLEGTSPEPYDPNKGGEMSSQPAFQRRIDWPIGLKNMSRHFSVVRIRGFRAFTA